MVQMETLSNQLLQNIRKLGMTSEVHAIQKCHHSKNKCFLSNPRRTGGRKSSSWDKGGKKCGNFGCCHSKAMPCLQQGMFQMQEEESFLKTLSEFGYEAR